MPSDPKLRRDYLIVGACWLKLIREVSELSGDFSKPELQGQQFTAPVKLKEGVEESAVASL
jgi:hypothetical protein